MAQHSKPPHQDGPWAGEKLVCPRVRDDDGEDVSWALSTAEAMWNHGDHVEAVKWIRRAAEAASACDADARHLELAKAAAELSSQLDAGERLTTVIPAPTAVAAIAPTAVPVAPEPPPPPPPPAEKPAAAQTIRPPSIKRAAPPPSKPPPPFAVPGADPDTTAEVRVPVRAPDGRRDGRGRAAVEDEPPSTVVPGKAKRPLAPDNDPESWPTQSFTGDELDDMADEHTRIGTTAYVEKAIASSGSRAQAPPRTEPAVKPSQAVRVVVWRDQDGVRVAPHGTKVSAIAVEAVLVALDPAADLAAWLTKK